MACVGGLADATESAQLRSGNIGELRERLGRRQVMVKFTARAADQRNIKCLTPLGHGAPSLRAWPAA